MTVRIEIELLEYDGNLRQTKNCWYTCSIVAFTDIINLIFSNQYYIPFPIFDL